VPAHLFGIPGNIDALRSRIRDHNIIIVEDAAQAMGETANEKKLGTLGDVAFFSLGRGKALSVLEGGVILTDRDDVAGALESHVSELPRYSLLRLLNLIFKTLALVVLNHPRVFLLPRSMPFLKLGQTIYDPHFPILRMSSFQAGLAIRWRQKLFAMRTVRRRNVARWLALLAGRKGHSPSGPPLALLRFPVRIGDSSERERVLRRSAEAGLGIMPAYPGNIASIPELDGTIPDGPFPASEQWARELVTLPTHSYLTDKDASRIMELLSQVSVSPATPPQA
jgi:dTDP-4-amino-4,6-dideoxygalactose transaminase